MPADAATAEKTRRMALWKRLVLIAASFGAGFALTLSLVVGMVTWHQSRPKPWNAEAIKASYASLEFTMNPDKLVVEFAYDLQNGTDADYKIGRLSDLTVMAKLAQGNALSENFGHYQNSDVSVAVPAFIPAKSKARVILRVAYDYPYDFTSTDKNDSKKVAQFLSRRLKEITGIVIFDQSNYYRIDMPSGWEDIKSD